MLMISKFVQFFCSASRDILIVLISIIRSFQAFNSFTRIKRMIDKRISLQVSLIFVVFTIQLTSCYSPTEGCLDPEATNYSITGDNDCEACCQYPDLKLSIFHENADTTFRLKDTITNDLGQQISLLDFVYLLSDFTIITDDGAFEVLDSISLDVDDGVVYTKDDIIRVSRNNFTFELGIIIFDGSTSELSFQAGLSNLLNENRFTSEINNHPLTNDPDSLFQSDKDTYVFQRIQVAQGVDFLDTVIYDIETTADISFPFNFESIRGEDKTMIIEAQYDMWFDGIDFEIMDKAEIETRIGLNTSNIFRQKN